MNEETLLQFVEKMCQCKDSFKIYGMLSQMLEILENTGAEQHLIDMVKEFMTCNYELAAYQIEEGSHMTMADMEILKERRIERLRREREAMRNGRC